MTAVHRPANRWLTPDPAGLHRAATGAAWDHANPSETGVPRCRTFPRDRSAGARTRAAARALLRQDYELRGRFRFATPPSSQGPSLHGACIAADPGRARYRREPGRAAGSRSRGSLCGATGCLRRGRPHARRHRTPARSSGTFARLAARAAAGSTRFALGTARSPVNERNTGDGLGVVATAHERSAIRFTCGAERAVAPQPCRRAGRRCGRDLFSGLLDGQTQRPAGPYCRAFRAALALNVRPRMQPAHSPRSCAWRLDRLPIDRAFVDAAHGYGPVTADRAERARPAAAA